MSVSIRTFFVFNFVLFITAILLCRYVYNIISELIRFQQTPYNLQPVTQIADLLCNFDDLEDTDFQGDQAVPPTE